MVCGEFSWVVFGFFTCGAPSPRFFLVSGHFGPMQWTELLPDFSMKIGQNCCRGRRLFHKCVSYLYVVSCVSYPCTDPRDSVVVSAVVLPGMEWFEDGMDAIFADIDDIDAHGNGGHGRTKAQETVAMQVDISKTGKHTYVRSNPTRSTSNYM